MPLHGPEPTMHSPPAATQAAGPFVEQPGAPTAATTTAIRIRRMFMSVLPPMPNSRDAISLTSPG